MPVFFRRMLHAWGILLFSSTPVFTQNAIVQLTITDPANMPVEGVWVRCGEEQALSNGNGLVSIRIADELLSLHRLGMKDVHIVTDTLHKSSLQIVMKYETEILNEVTVHGSRIDLRDKIEYLLGESWKKYKDSYSKMMTGTYHECVQVDTMEYCLYMDTMTYQYFSNRNWFPLPKFMCYNRKVDLFISLDILQTMSNRQPYYQLKYYFPLHPTSSPLKDLRTSDVRLYAVKDSIEYYLIESASSNVFRFSTTIEYIPTQGYIRSVSSFLKSYEPVNIPFPKVDSLEYSPPYTLYSRYEFTLTDDQLLLVKADYQREEIVSSKNGGKNLMVKSFARLSTINAEVDVKRLKKYRGFFPFSHWD